ncbi:MAG: hypothetical protein Q7U53_08235 [Anaerolineaceae bacterium]|nr:hypothetical protein [Anaerolineaceae bacterium]
MFSRFQFNLNVPTLSQGSRIPGEEINKKIADLAGRQSTINDVDYQILVSSVSSTSNKVVWIQLEADDQDPGRFWMKLIAGLRKIFPDIGKEILSSLIDHHSQPLPSGLEALESEIGEKVILILDEIQWITEQSWWNVTKTWLDRNHEKIKWIGLQSSKPKNNSSLNPTAKSDEVLNLLGFWDVYWIEWLQLTQPQIDWQIEIQRLDQIITGIDADKIFFIHPRYFSKLNLHDNKQWRFLSLQHLSDWLITRDEWLESLRINLAIKEFETAGDLLEKYAEAWMEQKHDPLELLFWLREIPGVLLTSQPILCTLAAIACKKLALPFLVNYYCNAAEHSLASLSRFSRDEEHWKLIEIDEQGLTIGQLLEKIENLKTNE